MKELLAHGAAVDAPARDGATPLIWAASQGKKEAVALLLQQGADVNARDADGVTALMEAVNVRSPELVKLLLEQGADPLLRNRDGKTAREMAKGERNRQVRAVFEVYMNGSSTFRVEFAR